MDVLDEWIELQNEGIRNFTGRSEARGNDIAVVTLLVEVPVGKEADEYVLMQRISTLRSSAEIDDLVEAAHLAALRRAQGVEPQPTVLHDERLGGPDS